MDLYERSMVLLSDADDASEWHKAALRLAEQLPVPLTSYRLGTGPDSELTPEGDVDWAERHGTTRAGAVLVRPDGFVAWRSSGPAPDAELTLRQILSTVLALS